MRAVWRWLTAQGLFLPGGGIDKGESLEDALVREALEECGFQVECGKQVAEAVQFIYSETERTYFEKRCTFLEATIIEVDPDKREIDHEVVWAANAASAVALLSHESHRWAASLMDPGTDGQIARDPLEKGNQL